MSVNYKQQGTHMLSLIRAINATNGDVCEMGAGFSSTPLLHWISLGRKLVTYESDPDYAHFARSFTSNNHKIRETKDFTNVDFNRPWSVVFIDHSPKRPRTRGDDAIKFSKCLLMVLHDTEPESIEHYGYDQVFKQFKYRYDWTLCKPFTTVLSNEMRVDQWT